MNRFISLQHDLFEITVDLAVGYFLDTALNHTPKFNVRFLLIYALQND
jgi:F0F1-type ATP synthase assembly protein I